MYTYIYKQSYTGAALVTVLEESPHDLETGDVVVLSRLQGLDQLMDRPLTVTKKDRFTFEVHLPGDQEIGLPPGMQYVKGGYANQVKQPVTVRFESMQSTLDSPGSPAAFITKMGNRSLALHIAFRYTSLPPPLPPPPRDII